MNILSVRSIRIFLFLHLFLIVSGKLIADGNGGETKSARNLEQAVMLLSDYLKFPSVTGREKAAGEFLSEFSEDQGLFVTRFSEEEGRYNFCASLYPLNENKPNIIFLNHIDVVPAQEREHWRVDPFSGYVDDSTVWGRGALDCKGLAIMQLMALINFKEHASGKILPFNVSMLAVSGEETGGETGAEYVMENFKDYLNPMVVFGEGGAGLHGVLEKDPLADVFTVSIAEKSNLWLKLTVDQECISHASTPGKVYANKTLIKALSKLNSRKKRLHFNEGNKIMFRELGKIEGGLKGFVLKKINWAIFRPLVRPKFQAEPVYNALVSNTITITQLNNPPGPPNTVSNKASAILDCRLLPGVSRKSFIRKVKKWIDEPAIEISVLNESPDAVITTPDLFFDVFRQAVVTENQEQTTYVLPVLFPATSDNSYFRRAGIPVYGIIPAVLARELLETVHGPNERLPIAALSKGINIYQRFLNGIEDHFPVKTIDLETKN